MGISMISVAARQQPSSPDMYFWRATNPRLVRHRVVPKWRVQRLSGTTCCNLYRPLLLKQHFLLDSQDLLAAHPRITCSEGLNKPWPFGPCRHAFAPFLGALYRLRKLIMYLVPRCMRRHV